MLSTKTAISKASMGRKRIFKSTTVAYFKFAEHVSRSSKIYKLIKLDQLMFGNMKKMRWVQ